MTFLTTAWTAIKGGFSSFLGGWQIYLGVAVVCLGLGSFGTYKIMHNANEAAVAEQAVKVVKLVQKSDAITYKVAQTQQAATEKVVTVTQTIIKEVPKYVSVQADAHCAIPVGFVGVFNAGATDTLPPSVASDDDAPSGVALSDVAKTSVDNDGLYYQLATQVKAWQDWYTEQKALSEKGK